MKTKHILKTSGIIACIFMMQQVNAQLYISNNDILGILPNDPVQVNGNVVNNGTFFNAGNCYVTGNIISNGTTSYNGGKLFLAGTTTQTISGTLPLYTTSVEFNNTSGIIITNTLSTGGQAVFTNGKVMAPTSTAPLELAAGAIVSAASVNSYVNGYVRALGTGNVLFPVGNATNYKPITVNITANGQGLTASYFGGDGGTANYTAGYNNEMLINYDATQYWNIEPLSTAEATITLPYDASYNAINASYLTNLKVAQYQNGAWHSEGGMVNGTQTNGTVTSVNTINNWSLFTIGTITDGTLNIWETDKDKFYVYPNPFTDILRISDIKGIKFISLHDATGRLIKKIAPSKELNLSGLSQGVYLLVLKMENSEVKTFKVIKK